MNDEENSKEERGPDDSAAKFTVKGLNVASGIFRVDPRIAVGMNEMARTVNKMASVGRSAEFQQWCISFAKEAERLNVAATQAAKQWREVHQELQQIVQHEGGLGPLREALIMDPAVVNQLSVALADLVSGVSRVTNVELPPFDVIEAVFTEALRTGLEAEPPEDDETEADEWFAAVIFERAWTGLEKLGITQEERNLILLVLSFIYFLGEPALKSARDTLLYSSVPVRSAVVSESKLRVEAADTAKVEALLKPGQDVEHLEEKEGWAFVRLFDEENEEYRIGWVRKEGLIPIEEER